MTFDSEESTFSPSRLLLDNWLQSQLPASLIRILKNISPLNTAKGCIVASPSTSNPDYFYHWVRDSALTMSLISRLYEAGVAQQSKTRKTQYLEDLIWDYAHFSRQNQLTENRSGGLGEPKFNVDGSAFNGDWGRPQNDGPALRAATLIHFAKTYLSHNGSIEIVKSRLYHPSLPANSVIKADLEYISHNWETYSFELWEEVSALSHFYTLSMQLVALQLGTDFALMLNDPGAAKFYNEVAQKIGKVLWKKHLNPNSKYIQASVDVNGGFPKKYSNLDVSVLLAANHYHVFNPNSQDVDPCSNATIETALELARRMKKLYPINLKNSDDKSLHIVPIAPAIGRYTEDEYDGISGNSKGNPWILATASYSELMYICVSKWSELSELPSEAIVFANEMSKIVNGKIGNNGDLNEIFELADAFLQRIRYHTLDDKNLSEQIDRISGNMRGAIELTWSHASLVTASWQRNIAHLKIKNMK
ncbi:Glucoamylase, intracellular sporulation-specific [Nowakowskiella sp. JEL0078]|nr:Glucoamylase, intracellular sporulation-specific [Nowakowskiella sp. JEL0078]